MVLYFPDAKRLSGLAELAYCIYIVIVTPLVGGFRNQEFRIAIVMNCLFTMTIVTKFEKKWNFANL